VTTIQRHADPAERDQPVLDQPIRPGIGCVPQVDDVVDPLKVSENLNMGGYLLSPRVRVQDEPTAGPSAVLTESVLAGQVRALADQGHAVLLVEQKAQAAPRLADTASVPVRGQVVISAPAGRGAGQPRGGGSVPGPAGQEA
jgi:ABC-type branched-subunit amino acid transport system ATPase component